MISIHALLAESDGILAHHARKIVKFLSTLSLRRATNADCNYRSGNPISIHALLAESDTKISIKLTFDINFYPRSPCGERRVYMCPIISTITHFYPRSPCGERPVGVLSCYLDNIISIHALLAESDTYRILRAKLRPISIHALLAESDHAPSHSLYLRNNFYPRSPCGERQCLPGFWRITPEFLSTLSLRRATGFSCLPIELSHISIHALLAESDGHDPGRGRICQGFLSTLSLRRAT